MLVWNQNQVVIQLVVLKLKSFKILLASLQISWIKRLFHIFFEIHQIFDWSVILETSPKNVKEYNLKKVIEKSKLPDVSSRFFYWLRGIKDEEVFKHPFIAEDVEVGDLYFDLIFHNFSFFFLL